MEGLEILEKYKRGFATKEYETIEEELKALKILIQNKDVEFNIGYDEEHDYWAVFCECEGDIFCLASGSGKEKYDLLRKVML